MWVVCQAQQIRSKLFRYKVHSTSEGGKRVLAASPVNSLEKKKAFSPQVNPCHAE